MKVSLYSSPVTDSFPAFPVSAPTATSRIPTAAAVPQRSTRVRRESRSAAATAPAWMLAAAACFLATGIAGTTRPVVDVPAWMTAAPAAPKEDVVTIEDITMADLAGDPAPESPDAAPLPAVPAEAADTPPEPEPLLTEEDIVTIPEAPEIIDAMRPLDPPPPKPAERKPRPATQPAPARNTAAAPATTPRPATTAPGGTGTGGNGGTTTRATGSGGKGKFPQPPYPSSARSRGITGTVYLSVRVSPSGDVTAATVSGSSGSSELDSHAASWVTRRWKWPAGDARSFRLPITFRLR